LMAIDSGTDSLIRSASRTAAGESVVYVSRALEWHRAGP
jgi:hypothetical protein